MADIIVDKLFNKEPFSWGAANLSNASNSRAIYLKAVKAADLNDYQPLLDFSRS